MKIDSVEFVVSAARLDDFPRDPLVELAVIGRSNVGKSSLINALVGRAVARTSGTPGKTRLVNFFRVRVARGAFYLVDLPGFGHTDSRAARGAFEAITRTYFESRAAGSDAGRTSRSVVGRPGSPRPARSRTGAVAAGPRPRPPGDHDRLAAVLLLVDSRHPGLPIDLAADRWLRTLGVHRLVVATKFDKLARSERPRTLAALEQAFQGPVLPVSAATGEYLDVLWRQILPCVNPTPPR